MLNRAVDGWERCHWGLYEMSMANTYVVYGVS